jgi:hypothetical protein
MQERYGWGLRYHQFLHQFVVNNLLLNILSLACFSSIAHPILAISDNVFSHNQVVFFQHSWC